MQNNFLGKSDIDLSILGSQWVSFPPPHPPGRSDIQVMSKNMFPKAFWLIELHCSLSGHDWIHAI